MRGDLGSAFVLGEEEVLLRKPIELRGSVAAIQHAGVEAKVAGEIGYVDGRHAGGRVSKPALRAE